MGNIGSIIRQLFSLNNILGGLTTKAANTKSMTCTMKTLYKIIDSSIEDAKLWKYNSSTNK